MDRREFEQEMEGQGAPDGTRNTQAGEGAGVRPDAEGVNDLLREVPEDKTNPLGDAAKLAPAFVLTRLDALVKPPLEEELSEPDADAGNPCSCNSVCTCVPVETCACNQVCTCDTVDSCPSYESTCYGGGGGYGGYYSPCS